MRQRCQDFWEDVIALAEGKDVPRAQEHVSGCQDCRTKLEQVREMFSLGDLRFYDAPSDAVALAKSLMQPERQTAGLLRSTLAWTGARTVAEDFQIVVGSGDVQTRLMFVSAGAGWEVLGRLPDSGWSVYRSGKKIEVDAEGRFSFFVSSLEDSAFVAIGDGLEIAVPNAKELLSDGRSDPR